MAAPYALLDLSLLCFMRLQIKRLRQSIRSWNMPLNQVCTISALVPSLRTLLTPISVPIVLRYSLYIRCSHDLQSRTEIWTNEPNDLYFHLLHSWFGLHYGRQSIWHSSKAYFRGKQPIHPRVDLCFWNCGRLLYFNTDELLQQSS